MTKNESKDLKLNENEKEDLYSLFYEIISEIKNCKIEIEEDDFRKNIQTISSKQLIDYLHDSIKILLKKKFEEGKEEQKKEETQLKLMKKIPIETNEINQLEYTLKKLEQKERNLIKLVFKYKLQKDAMKNKIEDLLDIEDEYEELKEKLKYEDGRFLENDRKDNEILILRQENTNLKKFISDNEKNYKKLEDELFEKEKLIVALETKIEKLNKTIEDKQREINMYSTINYENNINNSNYHLIKFGIDENEKYRFGILPKKTYIKEINLPENNMQIKHIYAFGKRIIIQKSSNDNKEILYLGGMDFSGFELDGFELLDFNEQKFLNTKIKNLCLGTNHCIILDEENNLYGIGDNTYGELGGSKVNVNSFSLLDKELLSKIWFQNADKKKFSNKNEFQIKKIVCGARHTLILSNDGKIFCLGDNSENQCYGLETRIQKPIKLELGIEKEIVDVYSGYTHNLIIIKNGDKEEILTWGDASMGKLGYNEEHLSQSNPKEILALKEKCVNYVCLGFQMSVIVTGSSQNALFKK